MTTPFKREPRYFVFKISDMRKHLSRDKFDLVGSIAEKLNAGRAVDGKPCLQAVVVESDWPEYERVWQMIEMRMSTGQSIVEADKPTAYRVYDKRAECEYLAFPDELGNMNGLTVESLYNHTLPKAEQEPVASKKDAVFAASIEFIGTLTGMEPPPIEVAPPEVFQPFKDFTEKVCAIFAASPQPALPKREPLTDEQIDYSIKKGDIVTNERWSLTALIVVDVNWALKAVALQLGSGGGIVVWPVASIKKAAHDITKE